MSLKPTIIEIPDSLVIGVAAEMRSRGGEGSEIDVPLVLPPNLGDLPSKTLDDLERAAIRESARMAVRARVLVGSADAQDRMEDGRKHPLTRFETGLRRVIGKIGLMERAEPHHIDVVRSIGRIHEPTPRETGPIVFD